MNGEMNEEINGEMNEEINEEKNLEEKMEQNLEEKQEISTQENNDVTSSESKELIFKSKKKESRKNVDGDYKKMNLTDLRKYVVENNINIDVSKMKKPEILKAMEELKKNESKSLQLNEELILPFE